MLSVLDATYENGYKIELEFNDHKKGKVDLTELVIAGKIKPFHVLQDIEKFKNFSVDYTVKQGDKLDLAPEYLYFKAFEDDAALQDKFRTWGYV